MTETRTAGLFWFVAGAAFGVAFSERLRPLARASAIGSINLAGYGLDFASLALAKAALLVDGARRSLNESEVVAFGQQDSFGRSA